MTHAKGRVGIDTPRSVPYDLAEIREVTAMNDRIVSNPNICGGEACVHGTRIPVRVILSHLAAGEDTDSLLRNFPRLTREDILDCIEYAAYLASERVFTT